MGTAVHWSRVTSGDRAAAGGHVRGESAAWRQPAAGLAHLRPPHAARRGDGGGGPGDPRQGGRGRRHQGGAGRGGGGGPGVHILPVGQPGGGPEGAAISRAGT